MIHVHTPIVSVTAAKKTAMSKLVYVLRCQILPPAAGIQGENRPPTNRVITDLNFPLSGLPLLRYSGGKCAIVVET